MKMRKLLLLMTALLTLGASGAWAVSPASGAFPVEGKTYYLFAQQTKSTTPRSYIYNNAGTLSINQGNKETTDAYKWTVTISNGTYTIKNVADNTKYLNVDANHLILSTSGCAFTLNKDVGYPACVALYYNKYWVTSSSDTEYNANNYYFSSYATSDACTANYVFEEVLPAHSLVNGSYYTIYCDNDNKQYLYDNEGTLAQSSSANWDLKYVWKCIVSGDYYNFQNAKTGKYLSHKALASSAYNFNVKTEGVYHDGCAKIYSVAATKYFGMTAAGATDQADAGSYDKVIKDFSFDFRFDAIDNLFPAGTHYVTFKGLDSGRRQYYHNDITQSDNYTLAVASMPNPATNDFIWKIVSDGNGHITSITNGQGNGIKPKGNCSTTLTSLNYSFNSTLFGFYLTSDQITGGHECLNANACGGYYQNANGDYCMTTWSGNNHKDNLWQFSEVDVTTATVYNVTITGNDNGYVTFDGQNAGNGGFFISSVAPTVGTLEAFDIIGYEPSCSIEGTNITVAYSPAQAATLNYILTDMNGATYSGTYEGNEGRTEPTIQGCYGYSLSNKEWDGATFTARITFPFNVSSKGTNNPVFIQSDLGTSLWYAKGGNVIADNEASTPTTFYDSFANNYLWCITPEIDEGVFYFTLYNVGADKYIPNNPSNDRENPTPLVDYNTAGAFCYSHYKQGEGFNVSPTSTSFLTINTSGTDQNIWLWPGGTSNATHRGSVMSFPTKTIINVTETFAVLKNTTKFDILDGSTVMGPGEFANPTEINAAIDAAQEVEDNAEAKIEFIESSNGTKIQNYLNQVATYGALANIQFTMNKEYGTMILPCPCKRITGLDIYSCSAQENGVLTLTPVAGNYSENVPYIIHAEAGSKYTIIGWDKGSTATHTSGWLTGVLNSDTDIPSGSYMLATNKSTGVQAFYQVSGSGVKCAINKCYLTVPSGGVKAFYFDEDGMTTAIEEIFGGETEQGVIYNLAGQRIQKPQKGINIINGKKIIK